MMIRNVATKTMALAATAMLAAAVSAQAATFTTTEYVVSYDDTTSFGSIGFTFAGGSAVGFGWNFSDSVNVSSSSGQASHAFDLPGFTVIPAAGYSLSGPIEAFLGNLVFTEFGNASTSATVSGILTGIRAGGSAVSVPFTDVPLDKTYTSGSLLGYFSGTASTPSPAFDSIGLSAGVLALTVDAPSGFASVAAQPQNEFKISFVATPVPEGEPWALLLSGLAMMGVVARRRLRAL